MGERMNNLSGKKWLQHSFSIWRDIDKNKAERKLKHPAMFPTQLTSRLIDIFSKDEGEVVLDPFLGSGSTVLSAYHLGKKGIGFEISDEYVKLAKKRLKEEPQPEEDEEDPEQKPSKLIKPEIYKKNIFDIPKVLKKESVDLVITSPPYWNILNERRSADGKEIRNYSDSKKDLGNIEDYDEFLGELKKAFKGVYDVMKKGKYFIVVVMDIRKKSKFYPFHMDIVNFMRDIGFEFDDLVIWDRQKEYNNMRPLGFPYVFRINKVHEFVLIFKK